jgi:DNA repair protein RecN (Recombination protein N)
MLHELHIRNFAIIDDLHMRFGPGLNVLTGETGAGKSIIIDALGLLLGDRATADWVRAGSERAEIEATFRMVPATSIESAGDLAAPAVEDAAESDAPDGALENAAQLRTLLQEQGLDDPDQEEWVTLAREVRHSGRNVCRVNGRAVSLQILSELASLLIDVHGQGEHLNLLRPRTHIHLLDRYAGLLPMRQAVSSLVRELRAVRAELERLRQDERTLAQRIDMLSFQVEEIVGAALQPGEDEELESERRRLSNAETLMTLSATAQAILSEDGGDGAPSALDLLGEVVDRLDRLARIDPAMQRTAADGQGMLEQLADLARDLQDYAEQLEFNPERLQEVEERLELISNLQRKYGDTIQQIVAFGERAQAELEELENWEIRTEALVQQEEHLLHQIGELAAQLSAQRDEAGERMARQVEAELADLNMTRARFGVQVAQNERADGAILPDGRRVAFDATGIDQVEFLISANPGEPLKPLARVASGGETARIMLALKSVLAHADATPTLIFDEIDQGIGGRVGAVVGRKLWNLTGHHADNAEKRAAIGTRHQVLCITHLPQLAAFGDQHFTVNKRVRPVDGGERTSTVVKLLEPPERIEELMQMLGAITAAGRQSVEEMLAEVSAAKAADEQPQAAQRSGNVASGSKKRSNKKSTAVQTGRTKST